VFDGFKALGISEQEIMLHGQQRGSVMFQPQPVPPGEVTPVAPSDRMVAGEPDQADRQLRETFPLSPLRLIPLQQTADTFKRAGTSLSDQATSLLLQSGAIDPDGAAQLIRRNARARSAAAPNQDIQEGMQAIGEAETFGQAAEAMLKNPKATMSMLVDSLLVSAPGLAATLAIGPAGAVARAGMAGVTSGGMEYAAVMTDVLQDRKVDLTNAEEVAKALQNPEILAEMKDKGAKRGLIIGGFDALSMGLAGRFLRPANELISAGKLTGAAAKKATVAAWSKELALQMGAGGGGEFVAQKATGEDKPAAVLLEALAEGVAAPVDVYGALSEARAREAVARVAPTPPVAERIEPTLPEVMPEAPGRAEPTIETEPTVEGRPEPTLPAEEEPVVLRPTRRGPPVEEGVADVPAIPGMPSIEEPSYVFTPIEKGVTPVAPAVEEPPVAPTPAAAALPETPTVPPVAIPKVPEPEAPQLETQGLATVEVPLSQLNLSKEVPQFKLGATAKGVVEPLGGKFERTGVAPIQVWRRLDGSLEVISGRHRLDLAQRSGEKTIPAQIHDEAQGFTRDHAAILDAELNIRDGQGKAKDYVNYFKASGIDRETAESRGLLARATGKRAFTIATQGSDELLAALRSDAIPEEAAFYIALNAPNDSRLQGVGISAINNGKTMNMAVNTMQAVKALAGEQNTTVDMFGFDDSAMREAEAMAKIASRKQRELQTRLSAITGAAKNPALAKAEGIDIKDPEAVKRRIEELKQQKAAWDNWQTNPDLIAEVRAERGTPPPGLQLTGETEAEVRDREEAEKAGALEAEKRRQADLARDMFTLEGETAPVETKAPEQVDIFAEPAEPKTGDVVLTIPAPDNMETQVFKTSDGYGTGLFDKDSGNFVDGSITRFKGDDARANAERKAQEVVKEATPKDRPDENDSGFRGASDAEVADVAEAFKKAKQSQDAEKVTRVLDAPKKSDIVRIEDNARIFVKDSGYLTVEQAKQRIEEWKRNAQQQGETRLNSDKIVLSLFDMTGEWSNPWEEAGYQVYRFDIQTDPEMGDVNKFSSEFFNDVFGVFEGQDIYAVLAACPCTDFASSGARHFAAKDADGRTVESVELVRQTLATIEYFKPSVWAIENPVGRIEKLTGLPPWRMSFNPNHFGDPYTKKTLLWGRFNANLPIAPVEPVEGSKMHRMYGGKSQATKNARSVTPEGFAYAFFQANNAIDNPVMALANKYDMMSPEVFKQAVDAGMTPQQVADVVDDPYYFDTDYKAADRALLDEVRRIKAERGEAAPEAPAVAEEPKIGEQETVAEAAADIEQPKVREKLKKIAENLGIQVFETSDDFRSSNEGYVNIPPEDKMVEGAETPDHVFAHELGHAIMQRRGMSFNKIPHSDVAKWIKGWPEIRKISEKFRPGAYKSTNPKLRKHANKPDEIIADALGSFLLGQSNKSDIQSLIDGIGLSDYDLGLVKFDRRAYEEQLLEKAKGQGSRLANIEPSLAEQEGDLIFGSQRIREENIKEYARLRRKLSEVPKKVVRGEAGLDVQRETTRLLKTTQELKKEIDATKPRRDTPERFLAKALEEYDKGNISADVLAVIQAAYSKQPGLLNGLMLRVQKQPEGGAAAADFNALARIVRLFKGTSGVDSPVSIRHELVHSLEQMMTPEQRQILVDQWYKSLEKAMQKHQDEKHQRYFKSVLDFMENPTQRNFQTATLNLPSYDMYQYMNPSEYWAVNAEPLMAAQLGTPWNRFKMAVRRLFEGLKDVFGFDNKSPIYKTFKQVMDGDGQRISQDMLIDHIQKVSDSLTLFNVEAPREERERVDELLDEFNRPKVTGRELETVKSNLMPSTSSIRSTFKGMIDNPSQAVNMIFGPLNRGIAQARNYLFFSGAGLEEADAKRYANQVRTANDEATATLALDNMLHGNGIAVQFLMQGGLRYNPNTKRIEAHSARGSMYDLYKNERALKNKLGDERGAMLAQGYFEAKRSRNIQNEMAQLAETLEVQKETLDEQRRELADMQRRNASPQEIGRQQNDIDETIKDIKFTAEELDNITQINEDKVLMSEEEIEAFLMQEAAYPELKNMMDAWTATNQRLLKMMREVRLISEKRYDRLSSIQDYVPWQRVQDDDVDIHYVGNPRSATNITKERAFKKGKTERAVDYIPDNMTDNIIRLTQSVLRQYAAGRIVNDYATRTEDGKIKNFAKVDRNKGRFDYISDGRRVVVEVKDPLIAEAVYGRDSVDLRAPAAIAAATNFMRRAITIDPFFQMSQVIKDAPTAAIVTGVRNPAALMGSVMTSFAKTVVNADPVADILRANGIGGFQAITRTPEAAVKRKRGLVNRSVGAATLELMDHIGDASDFAARIAAYKRTMAETGDEALALYRAANVINFNRLGSSGAIRTFVTYVNFANAYLQSIDTLFTALTARGARGRDTKKALAVMGATVAQLTALTLAYSMLVGGDEEYEKLDDGTKVRNFFIPKSITGTDSGILIPINTSAAFIFKAMPELTYNMFVSQATKTPMDATRYKEAVSEAAAGALFGPEPVPSAIRPIVEIAMNRSFFTERSLTPRGTETLEKFQQFTDQTSELGKLLGQAGGLSPIEWDHLIRGTTGIAGMMAQYGSNMIGEYLNVRPESTAKQLPGVGRFIAPEVGRGPEALFYDLHERVRKATSTYKDLEATGQYEKAEKFDDEKNLLIDLSREMNRTEAKLKKINSEIRMISRGREEGTAKERRKEITELQRDKQQLLDGIEMLRKEAGL
jgi:hypothetical protein